MKAEKDIVKGLKEQLLSASYNAEALNDENDAINKDLLIVIEENQNLSAQIVSLSDQLYKKQGRISELISEVDRLTLTYEPYHPKRSWNRTPLGWWRLVRNHQPRYAADIAFDFYPLSDWVRLKYTPFRPGRYAQLVVGPIRAEFYQQ